MNLIILGIATGILCGVWTFIAPLISLSVWGGFAGTTTYFASGKHGLEGIGLAIRCNIAGIACGMMIFFLTDLFAFDAGMALASGIMSAGMCFLGLWKLTPFIPGIFLGCFSTFAANGDWLLLGSSAILGAFLGYLCDASGTWAQNKYFAKKEDNALDHKENN